MHKSFEAYAIRAFERLEVADTAIKQLAKSRMLCELSSHPIEGVHVEATQLSR